jgi:hypothetical protein
LVRIDRELHDSSFIYLQCLGICKLNVGDALMYLSILIVSFR